MYAIYCLVLFLALVFIGYYVLNQIFYRKRLFFRNQRCCYGEDRKVDG